MLNVDEAMRRLTENLSAFDREAQMVYEQLVLPGWGGELHGLPNTLYGYMMDCFSWIDLLSAYWKGETSSRGQTVRLFEFMNRYVHPAQEANQVTIQMFRHTLMHTSQPREIRDRATGTRYQWLLHWGEHLPAEQHYTFVDGPGYKILNLGLLYFIADIKRGLETYLADLSTSSELRTNFAKAQPRVELQEFGS